MRAQDKDKVKEKLKSCEQDLIAKKSHRKLKSCEQEDFIAKKSQLSVRL